MLSNESMISVSSALMSGTSTPLTVNFSASDAGMRNGWTHLHTIMEKMRSEWAPAAMLTAGTSPNTTLLANLSDDWEQMGSLQLDCFQCNWTNGFNQTDPNASVGGQPTKSVFDISANISANSTNNYSLSNESTTFATFFTTNDSIDTIVFEADPKIHHPFLAVFLAIICFIVVFGNTLTMLSVYRERYLHTVTNYFVASLAVSDCLVGAVVMPFSVIHETMNKLWIFGPDWSDHCVLVLYSQCTASDRCQTSE